MIDKATGYPVIISEIIKQTKRQYFFAGAVVGMLIALAVYCIIVTISTP